MVIYRDVWLCLGEHGVIHGCMVIDKVHGVRRW